MDTPALTDQQKLNIHQLCADTGCRLEDSPRMMTDRDRWQENQENMCYVLLAHIDDDDKYI